MFVAGTGGYRRIVSTRTGCQTGRFSLYSADGRHDRSPAPSVTGSELGMF